MEIEMKYRIPDSACADRIWQDERLAEISDEGSREAVDMKAVYFDTAEQILQKNSIAFRVRTEGTKTVATLKWNGTCTEGLHVREEVNVPVSGEPCMICPSPDIFQESDAGKAVMKLVGDSSLESLLEIHFLRRKVKVDNERSICEVAIDTGEILTDYGTLPICELEIELYSGKQEDVVEIGEALAERYALTIENDSKYARGLQLIHAAGTK